MRITYFKIENYRNITLAECDDVPNLMVIAGANGCGKSAILNALMAAKENAAPTGGFSLDPRCVSANAEVARITLRISFSETERNWYLQKYNGGCPESDEIIVEVRKGGRGTVPKRSQVVKQILSWYSREYEDSPGFFDYIDAHRFYAKKILSTWNSSSLSDEQSKRNLGTDGTQKFNLTKEYLASLVMKDAQEMLKAKREGIQVFPDSLKDIRTFFNRYFAPMEFEDVQIDCSPFKYIIKTPKGEIDIDDLSSGEKEILGTYIHFHSLNPKSAVILFDEVDAHLHPELERRYFDLFNEMSLENQLIMTTHSPEIMLSAGSESLYVLSKTQEQSRNQLSRVTADDSLHAALSSIIGSNGMVAINKKVVFLEGIESSADRLIYESFFPPNEFNLSFIPVGGGSSINIQTAEKIDKLLTSTGTFQEFYSIIDGDIPREIEDSSSTRLFKLPVYHVENYLLDPEIIFNVTGRLLQAYNPYESEEDVDKDLKSLLKSETHLNPFTKAHYDSILHRQAKYAWDCVYKKDMDSLSNITPTNFSDVRIKADSMIDEIVAEGTWKAKCKGRDLLKAYCRKHSINYTHFRNLLISELSSPPEGLSSIFNQIL